MTGTLSTAELPDGWSVVPLRKIAFIGAGDPAPQDPGDFENGHLPFVRTADVGRIKRSGAFRGTRDKLTDDAVRRRRLRRWPGGTILIPKSGASTVLNNRVRLTEPAFVSSHLATVRARDGTDESFLYHALCRLDVTRLMGNAGYPSLSLDDLGSAPIPIPPHHVQVALAALFDSADRTIARAQAAAVTLATLRHALSCRVLNSLAIPHEFSLPNPAAPTQSLPTTYPTLPVSDALRPFRFNRRKQVPKSAYRPSGTWPIYDQSPNVPAAFTDDPENVLRSNAPIIIFGDHTKTFNYITAPFALGAEGTKPFLVSPELHPRYIFHALLSVRIPGTGYNRYWSALSTQRLPIPSPSEQQVIADVLDSVVDALDAAETVTSASNRLYDSILHRTAHVAQRQTGTGTTEC